MLLSVNLEFVKYKLTTLPYLLMLNYGKYGK